MGRANLRAVLMLCAFAVSGVAHAGELLWKQRPTIPPSVANATNGNSPTATVGNLNSGARVDGFGSSMPLLDAISAVVPPEYKVEWGAGVHRTSDQVVSWTGKGRFWTEVLSDIVATAGLEFTIVDSKVVISAVGRGPEASPVLPTQFEARAGDTVKATLSRWSGAAGWRLDWQASHDAIIEFGATFGDDFEASVDQLFEGFAGTNPKFDPWKSDNRVLIVRTESKL